MPVGTTALCDRIGRRMTRGIPALPAAERLDGAGKRCSEGILPVDYAECVKSEV